MKGVRISHMEMTCSRWMLLSLVRRMVDQLG